MPSVSNLNSLIFIAGYCEATLAHMERLCIDDIHRGVWEECPPMKIARTKFSAVQYSHNYILVMGGKDHEGQRTDSIEVFSCNDNQWIKGEQIGCNHLKMRKPRSGFAVINLREEG